MNQDLLGAISKGWYIDNPMKPLSLSTAATICAEVEKYIAALAGQNALNKEKQP